jgi:putative aminopeptidase FrvX
MQKQARAFLQALLETSTPSGHETAATRVWLDYVRPFADEVSVDAYGNAFAVINPKGTPRVMLEGHSDEVGLMVCFIDDEGFLWVNAIGGVDPKTLLGKRVTLHARDGRLPGVIGVLAPHMQTSELRDKSPKLSDIYIDIGAKSRQDAQKLIHIGTVVTLEASPVSLLGDTLCARGCDNKIGIWSSAEALRRYREQGSGPACIIAASHVQEEVGLQGARMGAFRWDPHVALVVDVCNATDYPDAKKELRGDIRLGAGPAIRVGPAAHPRVNERLEKLAKDLGIKLQYVPIPLRSGTNANAIYPARQGIPTGILSTPNRYMHSAAETVNLADLDQIPTLMAAFGHSLKRGETFSVHAPARARRTTAAK